MFGFRTLDPDPERAKALVEAVRIYPYARREDPPPTRVITPDGRAWSGDQPRGLAYWERLHDVLQGEIVDERDRFYLAMLRQLGIEQGKPFQPDERPIAILEDAVAAGELMAQANTFASASRARATGPTAGGTSRSCSTTARSAAPPTTSCSNARPGSRRRSASPRR